MNHLAALYLRQSIDLGEGIDRQRARTMALAEQRGWTVVTSYEDNAQSAKGVRGAKSAWARLLKDAEAGRFTHVIAVDVDRLLCSQRDLLQLIELGLKVVTVDGEIDLASADGEFRATLMTALARFEISRKSERQLRANAARSSNGRPVPGHRRYGYETDGITPREAEAETVRWMFAQADSGASVRSIYLHLKDSGIAPGTGTQWTPRRVTDTLNSQHYVGRVLHQGVWHESTHVTPLVSEDQAARVRTRLADPTRRTSPGPAVRHLLSGIAACGVCGSSLFYMRSYRCKKDASHPSIEKKFLEPLVRTEVIHALLSGPAAIIPTDETGMSLTMIQEALEAVQKRREGLLSLVREGLSDAAVERPHLEASKAEEAGLVAKRDDLTSTSVAAEVLLGTRSDLYRGTTVSLADAASHRTALAERFDGLTLERQRDLIRLLLDVVVNRGRGPKRIDVHHRIVTSLNGQP